MREITAAPADPPVQVEFTAEEFTQLAELFYSRAHSDRSLTREVLALADARGLRYHQKLPNSVVARSI